MRGIALVIVAASATFGCSGGGDGAKKATGTVVVTGAASQPTEVPPTEVPQELPQKPRATIAPLLASAPSTGNPTSLSLTVHATELWNGSAWVKIFESAAGVAVDLVSDPGAAFGQGAVPAGSYRKVRFTVANGATFSAASVGACDAATGATFRIDDSETAPDQLQLHFATAGEGGLGSWTANGSSGFPFLMSAPIEVRQDVTTRVTLQFETAGTVSCLGTALAIPTAPRMRTYSVVIPATQAFTGGEYWITHYNMTRYRDAVTYASTAADRATYRASSGLNLGWGSRASFGPPNEKGYGVLTLETLMTEHRRQLDEGSCTECGLSSGGGAGWTAILYAIDADRRVSFTSPDGSRIVGALSEDLGTFVAVTIDGDGRNADLVFGVQVGGAQTLSGTYAIGTMSNTVMFPEGSTVASELYGSLGFGWLALDEASSPDMELYSSFLRLTHPANVADAQQDPFTWSSGMKVNVAPGPMVPASVAIGADGTGALALAGASPQWTAASPDGRVAISVGDVTAADRDGSTATKYEHNFAVLLEQAAPGTLTVPALAGRWVLATRTDEMRLFGSGDAVVVRGVEYGTLDVDVAGNATFDLVRVDDEGQVAPATGAGTLRVEQACIGAANDAGAAYAWNRATCVADGGKILDVAVLSATVENVAKEVAWFVVDAGGNVASVVSTDGFGASAAEGRKMLGYLVRASH